MTRREGESIRIGDDIELVFTNIGRSRVRVGIRAPRWMPVVSREVKLVREENLAASSGPSPAALASVIARFRGIRQGGNH
jgi:carbon storage regulator